MTRPPISVHRWPCDGPAIENNVQVVLVLAAAENGVIGRGDSLPWDLPDDLQHFKRTTLGHPISWAAKPLIASVLRCQRRNLVITRDREWRHDGVLVCHSLMRRSSVRSSRR